MTDATTTPPVDVAPATPAEPAPAPAPPTLEERVAAIEAHLNIKSE